MSISVAPDSIANVISSNLVLRLYCPLGNPVATAATGIWGALNCLSALTASATLKISIRYV